MKVIFVFLVLFISTLSFAIPPYDMCKYDGSCSAPQEKIYSKFKDCSGYDPKLNAGVVYSGSCYHYSKGYSNNQEHHGVMYFNEVNNDARFGGAFSFFFKQNPYQYISNEEASHMYSKSINKKKHTLKLDSMNYGYVMFDAVLPESHVQYWFKTCNGNVLMQGMWGYHHHFTCELKPNE